MDDGLPDFEREVRSDLYMSPEQRRREELEQARVDAVAGLLASLGVGPTPTWRQRAARCLAMAIVCPQLRGAL